MNQERAMEPGAGNLGLTQRSYERLYYNARGIMQNVPYFVERMIPWTLDHIADGMGHRRIVGRFLMTENDLEQALYASGPLQQHIEAVIPVGQWEGSPLCMVMVGVNNDIQRTNDPLIDIEGATHQIIRPEPHQISQTIDHFRSQGISFQSSLETIPADQILSMWAPIFEWTPGNLANLRLRLEAQQHLPPNRRSVWITAAVNNGQVVSLAMAERLNLPLGNREDLVVVESTEWCVRSDWQGNGLGAATVSHIHAQVLENLAGLSRPPVIVAETNYTSGAHKTGVRAGMVVGERNFRTHHIPQVLSQNVAVGDGLRSDRLRDFTFMYIDAASIERLYSPSQRHHMLGGGI